MAASNSNSLHYPMDHGKFSRTDPQQSIEAMN